MMYRLFLTPLLLLVSNCQKRYECPIYTIPQNYKGILVVIYDSEKGDLDGLKHYKFSKDGVLVIKTDKSYSEICDTFRYDSRVSTPTYDKNGGEYGEILLDNGTLFLTDTTNRNYVVGGANITSGYLYYRTWYVGSQKGYNHSRVHDQEMNKIDSIKKHYIN